MKPFLLLIAGVFLLFSSCKKKDYEEILHNPKLYSEAVFEVNSVVMGNNFSPPVASRNYAYASVAGYEVIAAGYPDQYKSLVGQLNGFEKVAKPSPNEKIDYPYAALLAFCHVGEAVTFPAGSMKLFTDSLHQLAVDHGMPSDVIANSENYAKEVAKSVMAWSKK